MQSIHWLFIGFLVSVSLILKSLFHYLKPGWFNRLIYSTAGTLLAGFIVFFSIIIAKLMLGVEFEGSETFYSATLTLAISLAALILVSESTYIRGYEKEKEKIAKDERSFTTGNICQPNKESNTDDPNRWVYHVNLKKFKSLVFSGVLSVLVLAVLSLVCLFFSGDVISDNSVSYVCWTVPIMSYLKVGVMSICVVSVLFAGRVSAISVNVIKGIKL